MKGIKKLFALMGLAIYELINNNKKAVILAKDSNNITEILNTSVKFQNEELAKKELVKIVIKAMAIKQTLPSIN